ncbi:RluA family pseudouridine synthase [Psychrobium sp. 1_MG-2023]|uniref:RluA family pseudouridine synthase n=1 Tax=Psychrobium sp. 1_MG-2023 TaxID=3062624 RepID=UPI000C33C886|nr:RluA family pseudouridine synthase [Psychrobium sp. 1_MG-2023]MDP2561288.1 RluA family pseudouridine synthase [Psychrobium sp. 1_MG-2023]PKF54105.1 RNA pseudouridine synthase [Alteromonadales bacterium alter-6D02]
MTFVYNPPVSPWLDIIYQDDDIAVLNKPSGLLSVPGRQLIHRDSLTLRLMRVLPTALVVHRLDMDTSGLMLFALNKAAQSHISRQFQQRTTEKKYLARVLGHPEQSSGSVDLPLICDWPNRPLQMVDHENGKPSLTHWQILSKEENSTLVELTPVTGRSHQLRVHMQQIGHPILGDDFYGRPDALPMSPRLDLHALTLTIEHPSTEERITFTAPSPFEPRVSLT